MDATKLPNPKNVAVASTFVLEVPVGLTYQSITLAYTNVTRAQLDNLKVLVNDSVIMEFSDGDELDFLNDYYGRADAAGELTFYFYRPEFVPLSDQLVLGLGTADVNTLKIQGDIDAAAAGVTIEAYAERSAPENLGAFTRIIKYPLNLGVAGLNEVADLRRGPRMIAAHFRAADITNMEVVADYGTGPRVIHDLTKTRQTNRNTRFGRVPNANAFHVDFCAEGDLSTALITEQMRDLRFRATKTAGGACTTLVEYLDVYAGN